LQDCEAVRLCSCMTVRLLNVSEQIKNDKHWLIHLVRQLMRKIVAKLASHHA